MTGWNEHGHAVLGGSRVDRWLGSGELQDAENCGYDPASALTEMGVDESVGAAHEQYRAGRITLRDGTVLERGGTLGAVWAVSRLPQPLAVLNTSVLTSDGSYSMRTVTLDEARRIVADAAAIDSAVGHDATAAVLTALLGREIPVNRQQFIHRPGQRALVLKLNGRPPEGVVLDQAGMEALGFTLRVLERIS
jgi:hypothetical protein